MQIQQNEDVVINKITEQYESKISCWEKNLNNLVLENQRVIEEN